LAQKVILYKTGEAPQQFLNAANASIEHGVLTFYWKPTPQTNKKVSTTIPFLLEEDIA
jgi:hypothetical protein